MRDFTKGNTTKQLLLFTLPVFLGSIFQQFYSIADAIVVGRFVSGGALAVIGSSVAIVGFINSSLLGITTGASVIISYYYGASEERNLHHAFSTSMLFLIVMSVLFSAAGFVFTPYMLRLLSTPVEVFDLAVLYQRITLIGLILSALFNMYASYMRALGDSKHPLYILIISSVENIILDFVLVAWLDLGISGAAAATIISQATGILLCILCVRQSIPLLKLEKLIFDRKIFSSILKNSLPAAIQMTVTSLLSLAIVGLVNSLGELQASGYSAAIRIDSFAILPIDSISMTLSTFVGQNIGAGLEDRAKKGRRSALIFMLSIAVLIAAIILVTGRRILLMFVNIEEAGAYEIVRYGWEFLSVVCIFYVLHALFFSFNGFFRGVGDAFIVMILTIMSLSLRALFSYYFARHFSMGPAAIAWAIPIGWGLCSTVAWIYYKKERWRGKLSR